jgi:hypothetical protein
VDYCFSKAALFDRGVIVPRIAWTGEEENEFLPSSVD